MFTAASLQKAVKDLWKGSSTELREGALALSGFQSRRSPAAHSLAPLQHMPYWQFETAAVACSTSS